MAGEAFVAEVDRPSEGFSHGRGPGPGGRGHRPFLTGRLERQSDDELIDPLIADDSFETGRVGRHARCPGQGAEGPGGLETGLSDRQADPPLPEVDAEQSRHGALPEAAPVGAVVGVGDLEPLGEADGAAGVVIVNERRSSLLGIVVTQFGQTLIVTVPNS